MLPTPRSPSKGHLAQLRVPHNKGKTSRDLKWRVQRPTVNGSSWCGIWINLATWASLPWLNHTRALCHKLISTPSYAHTFTNVANDSCKYSLDGMCWRRTLRRALPFLLIEWRSSVKFQTLQNALNLTSGAHCPRLCVTPASSFTLALALSLLLIPLDMASHGQCYSELAFFTFHLSERGLTHS